MLGRYILVWALTIVKILGQPTQLPQAQGSQMNIRQTVTNSNEMCSVRFGVNPSASNFTISGSVVKPLTTPLELVYPSVITGFQGNAMAQLSGPCPTSAIDLAAALAGSQLVADASTDNRPLVIYPANITVS